MTTYEFGELVDLTIRSARVVVASGPQWQFAVGNVGEMFLDAEVLPGVAITRVAPKEWPPQPGDIWNAPGFGRWFARGGEGQPVQLTPESFTAPSERPDELMRTVPGLRLVYREGWSPEAAPAAEDEPETLDQRAETIAGLRELADWLETNPGVPLDGGAHDVLASLSGAGRSNDEKRAELLRVAGLVGEQPDFEQNHPGVVRKFRGRVAYRAYYIPSKDIAGEGGEVAAPAGVSGAAAAPTETGAATPCLEEVAGARSADGDAPATGSDELVWVAAQRKGIDYHADNGALTKCGRSAMHGEKLLRSEATEFAKPCPRCYPNGAA